MLSNIVTYFILYFFAASPAVNFTQHSSAKVLKPIVNASISLPEPIFSHLDTLMVNPAKLSKKILIDIKYATTDNFTGEQLYPCPTCYLRPEAAKGITKAETLLESKGMRLKLYDCYRPFEVQKIMYSKAKNKRYVANPNKGSMHNRGLAVDVTLTDANGKELDMGTPYDYFGKKAAFAYPNLSPEIKANRHLLRETMAKAGFSAIQGEWWHFNFRGAYYAPVENLPFTCNK